jgi:hypothetical protein
MNYVNYDDAIVIPFRVKLAGYPLKDFASPSTISNTADLRTLRDAYKTGSCKWVRLTEAEVEAHAKDIEVRRKNGETIGKARKKRKDAGVLRKRKVVDVNDENQDPSSSKKRKVKLLGKHGQSKAAVAEKSVRAKSKRLQSREYIDSDEDDEDLD